MTVTTSGSSTAQRITWVVLVVAAAGAAAALGWFAGQRAEQRDATAVEARLAVADPQIGKAGATGANPAAPTVRSGTSRAEQLSVPARAASNANSRELKPLPWPFWEFRLKQPIPPRSPPLVPPSWRLIGATESAGTWSLVVLRQGNSAPEFFKVGDDLPGGYRIAAITQDDATLISGGRQVVLSFIGIR